MISKLIDISKVIDELSLKDWERLFKLIPEMEKTKDFIKGGGIIDDPNDPEGFMITPIVEADIVQVFEKTLYDLSLIIDFNWPGWDEGRTIADDQDFENKDTVTLLKLFTAFVRNNRFCDGVLAQKFEDRTIEKILKQIKKNIESQ
jgi:hypothetical protein